MTLTKTKKQYLSKLYYNPQNPSSFRGVDAVYRAVKKQSQHRITRKEIKEWLQAQPTYTLHKPARIRYPRNRVIVGGIDQQWQADLVDVSSISSFNNGNNFLLTCIDVFSKYAWAIPIKRKTGANLITAFKDILDTGRKPQNLQTDKGTEFTNKPFQAFLKENSIHFFTTHSDMKASIVERFNRTLKTKMWKYFTWKNTLTYIDVLPELMTSYNNSFHRSIKTTPASVNVTNEKSVWDTLYSPPKKSRKRIRSPFTRRPRFKFNVGDSVRISKARRLFKKGYLPSWTEEIFTISQRLPRHPPVYRIKDYDGEELEGIFYEPELETIIKTDDVYRVEKVVKTRTRKGKKEYFVKWMGYPDKFNQWVLAKDLEKIKT